MNINVDADIQIRTVNVNKMGTNYYKIPTEEEMTKRKEKLIQDVTNIELTPINIERNFDEPIEGTWNWDNAWNRFIDESRIHLGKRSGGWKFTWNFHNDKYYSNKEELLSFIRSGRVVNEYGDLIDNEEFIKMALEWGQPDGAVYNKEYTDKMRVENKNYYPFSDDTSYYSKIIDGLVVSSSTDFS